MIPNSTSLGRLVLRAEVSEERVGYYLRRHVESSQVAEVAGKVAGFMNSA